MLIDILNKVRNQDVLDLTMKQKAIRFLLIFLLGIMLGFGSKYIEGIPHIGQVGDVLDTLASIFTQIGIWVFIATIISAWSRNPKMGGIYVFLFFSGTLLAYYAYSMKLFGFFPTYYFIRWGVIASMAPLAAYIVWFSRGEGWIAAFCASLPIGLLVYQGYGYFSIVTRLNLIFAIVLLIILPKGKYQLFRIIPFAIAVAVILKKFSILSYLIGGL